VKKSGLVIVLLACLIAACDNVEIKTNPKVVKSASLNCQSPNNSLSKKERQAIGDLCFKQGNYTKSSGIKW
jgi:hypothetical protein